MWSTVRYPINNALMVAPHKGWGEIAGTVTGTACWGNTATVDGVQVRPTARAIPSHRRPTRTAPTPSGAVWQPVHADRQLERWIAQTTRVSIKAGSAGKT